MNVFGHVSDGNIRFNVLNAPIESKSMVNQIVHNIVIACGGSISAEHGIGRYRRSSLSNISPRENFSSCDQSKSR
ncbi:MAG: hypothetical protein KGL35_29355 [Bradyrhizobium sp.]|nr:hypothetical protein [Pseudomonadota bacterium]MDE2069438.1 hypothetical protein [Bradyrhizobium sp.]MDE2472721.1 hypothetical protein [Bradyrhizobium sp.]